MAVVKKVVGHNVIIYRLLAFFFGVLGIHNFYADEKSEGWAN